MNKDLLAATSVFAELVNNDIDYKDVINSFIISTYNLEGRYVMNSQEITHSLTKNYDFDIPEAVIKGQLNSLYKKDIIEYNQGNYIITPEMISSQSQIKKELNDKVIVQNKIFEKLVSYIQLNTSKLSTSQIEEVNSYFVNYLFDNSFNGEYSELVSKFIIINSSDENFTNELNLIREGIILFRGFKFSHDFGENDLWNTDLNIYLDTEHLFSINGYNGELHKKMVIDFYDLVRDLNTKIGTKRIYLSFFHEAKDEIEKFFNSAKEIFDKKRTKDISNQAMKFILDGVKDKSEIIKKEAKFFENLKTMGIFQCPEIQIPDEEFVVYNIENPHILNKYCSQHEEGDIINIMKTFTNINYLRKGKNNLNLENIKHILVSADSLTRKISRDIETKISESDFSFSTDLYYITHRLWFKLNKGFGFKGKLPTTLDVVAKAQVIISNKLNNVVHKRFELIKNDITNGIRTEDEVKSYYLKLRANSVNPEELNSTNIEEKTKILFENEDIEKHLKEETLLKQELEELKQYKAAKEKEEEDKRTRKEAAKKLSEAAIKKNQESKIKKYNTYADKILSLINISLIIFPFILSALILYIFKAHNHTTLDTINFIMSAIPFLSFIGYNRIKKFAKEKIEQMKETNKSKILKES